MNNETLTILHLSDLHVGLHSQDWLWPKFKQNLFDDFESLIDRTGHFDAVVFSGDLVQSGQALQFERLDEILGEMWVQFEKMGFSPPLFVIPGNHDIQRRPLTPELRLLKSWWREPEVREEFFATEMNSYRSAVSNLFLDYQNWYARLAKSHIKLTPSLTHGLLPGDSSSVVSKGSMRVGFVGLNSTWLQLDGAHYEAALDVDVRQLLSVTNDDPDAWCKSNTFNFLISHHPSNWLHSDSLAKWRGDIHPPGRFNAHLFGHMHEPFSLSSSTSGSVTSHSVQAASLFGLANVSGSQSRIHGYSVFRLTDAPELSEIRVWPRLLHKKTSGDSLLGPDNTYTLEEDTGSYVLESGSKSLTKLPVIDEIAEQAATTLAITPKFSAADEVLKKVRYHLPELKAHTNVRHIEQKRCLEVVIESRACWIVSAWGLGEDGFVSAVLRQIPKIDMAKCYRLDLSDYRDRDQLFSSIKAKLGCSIERFSELLSNLGDATLLLDNVVINSSTSETIAPEADLEEVIKIVLEYCPQLIVFVRARRKPSFPSFQVIELNALDEPDLKSYVSDHEKGGPDVATAETIAILKRHTDGIPARIDLSLRHLEVVPVTELANTDADLLPHIGDISNAPPGLATAINDLRLSLNPSHQRAYILLTSLAIFPLGEQLARLKRFIPNQPFFADHATELRDRSLIDVAVVQRIDVTGTTPTEKTLIVPRAVREILFSMMDQSDIHALNRKAADHCFGISWQNGSLKRSTVYKYDDPHCDGSDIANAATIIVRLAKEAHQTLDNAFMSQTLGLANLFLGALVKGDHYRSVVSLCDDLLPLMGDEASTAKRAALYVHLGAALRMTHCHERAEEILLQISEYRFPAFRRQNVLLNLALCYQALDKDDLARDAANRVIEIDRHSNAGLQARGIIIELRVNDPLRMERLAALEKLCRKNDAIIAANNIALLRVHESDGDPETVRRLLAPVVKSSGGGTDYYNRIQAIIRLTLLSLDGGQNMSDADLAHLVGCYHFLFNERIPGLFDQCHDALWRSFDSNDDDENLLRLFRLSSFYWRLRSSLNNEARYMRKLNDRIPISTPQKMGTLSREAAYFQVRAASSLRIEHQPAASE